MGVRRTVGMARGYRNLHLQNSISCPVEASNTLKHSSVGSFFFTAYMKWDSVSSLFYKIIFINQTQTYTRRPEETQPAAGIINETNDQF